MSPELLALHVYSQLIGRWIPPHGVPTRSQTEQDVDWAKVVSACMDRGWIKPSPKAPPGVLLKAITRHLTCCADHDGWVATYGGPRYPSLLKEIKDPPLALTCIGRPLPQDGIAVIGSRKASYWGLKASYHFGRWCAFQGVPVVSGGAFGCDIHAHKGLLSCKNSELEAIVVFAGGLDQLYPRHHRDWFRQIIDRGGTLVSERLWWAPSLAWNFPVRNRIIAGLCPMTVVMQAKIKSGAMITAKTALDQGRDVMVLRFPQPHPDADGNEQLIEDGARPIEWQFIEDIFSL